MAFNPRQPRVPRGTFGGGRFMSAGTALSRLRPDVSPAVRRQARFLNTAGALAPAERRGLGRGRFSKVAANLGGRQVPKADKLAVTARIDSPGSNIVRSSRKLNVDGDNEVALATVDTPRGRTLRLGIRPLEEGAPWSANDDGWTVALDQAGVRALAGVMVDVNACGKERQKDFRARARREGHFVGELEQLQDRERDQRRTGEFTRHLRKGLAPLSPDEESRRQELLRQHDQIWAGFGESDDTFMSGVIPAGFGDLVWNGVGSDDGDGGYYLELLIRTHDAGPDWDPMRETARAPDGEMSLPQVINLYPADMRRVLKAIEQDFPASS